MKSKREVEELFEKPKNDMPQNRPRVRGTVVLLSFMGIANSILAYLNIDQINTVKNDPRYIVPDWLLPVNYAVIVFGIMSVVAAVLIARYKRAGLYLGAVVIIISLLAAAGMFSMGGGSSIGCGIIFQVAALYYIHKYLTQLPEASFFT
jgi:hypothetical protein